MCSLLKARAERVSFLYSHHRFSDSGGMGNPLDTDRQ